MNLPPPSGKVARRNERRKKAAAHAPETRFRAEKVLNDANNTREPRKSLTRREPGKFLKVKKC